MEGKLNRLLTLVPEGLVVSAWTLRQAGFSDQLLAVYKKGGWLVSPSRGVYRRPGPPLVWQQAAISLQRESGWATHVGGFSALVERGVAHYIGSPVPRRDIELFGPSGIPGWANRLGTREKFVSHNDAMFGEPRPYQFAFGQDAGWGADAATEVERFDVDTAPARAGLIAESWGPWRWPLWLSANERAFLELLQHVPDRHSVYEADLILQGLTDLRPALLNTLLPVCTIKVRRLFLALADRHDHAWFGHLARIDIGSGKRMLVPGGKLHARYLITLPDDLDTHNG